MKISIIIPNYNGSKLIKKNLPDVIKCVSGYEDVSIIVVDDGSRPDDVIELRKTLDVINMSSKKSVNLIEREKNGGFSSAVNTGVKASRGDLVFLLNSDAVPLKGFLDPIIKRFEKDDELFGVGAMDISIEGSMKVKRGRGVAFWKKGILRHRRGDINKEDTFWISGGSSMMRRDLYEKFGGMDEIYNPFYWEDIDLSYRVQKSGYKIIFEKESMIEHRHDEGAIKTNFKQNKIMTIVYRNQFIFHWKNITDSGLIAAHIFWMPFHLLNALIHGDFNLIRGFIMAFKMMPVIMKHRKKQKKLYVKKDKDII